MDANILGHCFNNLRQSPLCYYFLEVVRIFSSCLDRAEWHKSQADFNVKDIIRHAGTALGSWFKRVLWGDLEPDETRHHLWRQMWMSFLIIDGIEIEEVNGRIEAIQTLWFTVDWDFLWFTPLHESRKILSYTSKNSELYCVWKKRKERANTLFFASSRTTLRRGSRSCSAQSLCLINHLADFWSLAEVPKEKEKKNHKTSSRAVKGRGSFTPLPWPGLWNEMPEQQ